MSEHSYPVTVERVNEVDAAERPDESISQVFDRIRNGAEQAESKLEERVVEKARRLAIDAAGLEQAKAVVRFPERAEALALARSRMMEKFERAVEKALAPVVTMLALNTAPVLAQDVRTERMATTQESSLTVQAETRVLKKEDVFVLDSPLAVVGEKMKALQRELLPEELALLKEFHAKAWQEANEWSMVSGKNRDGKFLVKKSEGGADFVHMPWELTQEIDERYLGTHTHPLEVEKEKELKDKMRQGTRNAFVAPPSSNDLVISCQSMSMNQVVDPRGVWQYSCDKDMMRLFLKPQEQLKERIHNMGLLFALSSTDTARVEEAFTKAFRYSHQYVDEYFERFVLRNFQEFIDRSLSQTYPGIEKAVHEHLNGYKEHKAKLTEALVDNDHWGEWIRRVSSGYSDEELAIRIRNLIANAERKGIAMSYTPFKDVPEDRNLKK